MPCRQIIMVHNHLPGFSTSCIRCSFGGWEELPLRGRRHRFDVHHHLFHQIISGITESGKFVSGKEPLGKQPRWPRRATIPVDHQHIWPWRRLSASVMPDLIGHLRSRPRQGPSVKGVARTECQWSLRWDLCIFVKHSQNSPSPIHKILDSWPYQFGIWKIKNPLYIITVAWSYIFIHRPWHN